METRNPTSVPSEKVYLEAIHYAEKALGETCLEIDIVEPGEEKDDPTTRQRRHGWRYGRRQEAGGNHSELEIPIRLVSATIRQRQRKDDKRVLLELPIEERNLLKPLLGDE